MTVSHKHRNCITDRLARAWWQEYRHVTEAGNPLGISFVEYVAARVASLGQRYTYSANTTEAPVFVATCGHAHFWGVSCTMLAQ